MTCDLVSALSTLPAGSRLMPILLQERPCTRCIKRNIGHLCHDEPREGVKKSKTDLESANGDKDSSQNEATASEATPTTLARQPSDPDPGLNLAPPPLPTSRGASTAAIAQPTPVSAPQLPSLTSQSPSRKLHAA